SARCHFACWGPRTLLRSSAGLADKSGVGEVSRHSGWTRARRMAGNPGVGARVQVGEVRTVADHLPHAPLDGSGVGLGNLPQATIAELLTPSGGEATDFARIGGPQRPNQGLIVRGDVRFARHKRRLLES